MEGNSKSIKVYGRIKPFDTSKGSELVEYDIYDRVSVDNSSDCLGSKIVFTHKPSAEAVNNKVEQQIFRFCKVFDQDSTQSEIYEVVAKPVVDSVLEGYNGTVFAYGQTGSGKTYSITGGPDNYEDRGIIPRSIQQIFESLPQMTADSMTTVFISYCEIYNETGYDLLDAGPKARTRLEDLPRISISEDVHGNFHFRNLNLKKVETEEEALNLLFVGDSNRVTAETPTNKTSSRSHCVFTIVVTTRSDTTGIVRRSKLNLVDLAGSERVSKTLLNGRTLEEAKNINLSLHFLEQVIVALNSPDSKHIPYRNSIMTIILKDSLGGNCLTTMLATLSVELENILETISTCRFAQRVALIRNEVHVNEELDPHLEIKILREDIKTLKKQLVLAGAPSVDVELTPDEIGECHNLVKEILSKETMDSMPPIPPDLRKINQCTWLLKNAVVEAKKSGDPEVKERQACDEDAASPRDVDDSSVPNKQSKRPSNQSYASKYSRSHAGSVRSNSSRPRDSQQLEDDKDIATRIEDNMRRLASLRSLLEHTRSTNSGDEMMDEFIAGGIHQIHEDERDYRMLLALPYDQQTSEDLLMEQVEISKLKMLFDFRNMYQELASSVDGKSGTPYDLRSVGNKSENMNFENRSPKKFSLGGADWELPTLEEASVTNTAETESLDVNSKSNEPSVLTARKQSTPSTSKTDSPRYNDSVQSDKANNSRKVSAVSQSSRGTVTSPRRTSRVSTNGSQSPIPVGNLSAHLDMDETFSRSSGSAGSTAARRSLGPTIKSSSMSPRSNAASTEIAEIIANSPQNASATSAASRRSHESQASAGSGSKKSAMLVNSRLSPEIDSSVAPDDMTNHIDPSTRIPSNISYKSATRRSHESQAGSGSTKSAMLTNSRLSPEVDTSIAQDEATARLPSNISFKSVTRRSASQASAGSGSTKAAMLENSRLSPEVNTSLAQDEATNHIDSTARHPSNISYKSAISTATRRSHESQAGSGSTKAAMLENSRLSPEVNTSLEQDEATNYIDPTTRLPSNMSYKSATSAGEIPVDLYSEYPNSKCSEDTRGSLLQQMGIGSLSSKMNPLASALAMGSVFSVHPATTSSVPKSLVKSNALLTGNVDGNTSKHANDVSHLQKISSQSTATRASVGPHSGTRRVSWNANAPPYNMSDESDSTRTGTGSLPKASVMSTGTGRPLISQKGASRMSTISNAIASPSIVPMDGNNGQNSMNNTLQNAAVVSTATVKSLRSQASSNNPANATTFTSSENYDNGRVTIPGNIDTTCPSTNPDEDCTDCPVTRCLETPAENVCAAAARMRQSLAASIPGTSNISNTRESIGRSATSDVTAHGQSSSSLILDYLSPTEDTISQPNSSLNVASASPERSSGRLQNIETSDSPIATCQSSCVPANEPTSSDFPGVYASDDSSWSPSTILQQYPNISMNSYGVASGASKSSTSPRGARRCSTESSVSQDVSSQIASTSMSQNVKCPGNEQIETSMQTIYKGGSHQVPESLNTFRPREDMHQCEDDKKCLALSATQKEFNEHYVLPRPDNYSSRITIPLKGTETNDLLGCYDVIPCTTSEFEGKTVPADRGTISTFADANANAMRESMESNTTPPAVGVTVCDSVKPDVGLVNIEELCLTGDPEIDEEIIAFYKARNCIG